MIPAKALVHCSGLELRSISLHLETGRIINYNLSDDYKNTSFQSRNDMIKRILDIAAIYGAVIGSECIGKYVIFDIYFFDSKITESIVKYSMEMD